MILAPGLNAQDPAHRCIARANAIAAARRTDEHVPLSTREELEKLAAAFGVAVVPAVDHRVGCAVPTPAGGRVTFDAPAQTRHDVAPVPDGLEEYREVAAR